MGLFNSLSTIGNSCSIEISNSEYIDVSNTGVLGLSQKRNAIGLNNGIISGVSCEGRANLIDCLLYDAVNSRKPVIYVRNRVNNPISGRFGIEIEQGALGSHQVVVDITKKNGGINLFKGMTLDVLADCLVEMMAEYIVLDDPMKDFTAIWFDKIFELLKTTKPKEKFKLENLKSYTFDWAEGKYDSLYQMGVIDQNRYTILMNELRRISGVYQSQMLKFTTFGKKIESNGLGGLFSGRVSIKDIYERDMVLLINLNDGASKKESDAFFRFLLKRLVIEETSNTKSAVCMIEDVNVKKSADLFLSLLSSSFSKGGVGEVYFTEKNITWWSENTSNVAEHPASYCNAFFVFKQNVNTDLKYWSALSGATKKIEVSHNQAPMSSVYRLDPYSWTNILFGRRMVYSGNSSKEVDTYRVEEQEIDNLDSRSCITIIKTNEYIYNRKVRWS